MAARTMRGRGMLDDARVARVQSGVDAPHAGAQCSAERRPLCGEQFEFAGHAVHVVFDNGAVLVLSLIHIYVRRI